MAFIDIIMWGMIGVMCITVAWFMLKVRGGFKTLIFIWEERANGTFLRVDRGKRIKEKNGETYYKLKKSKAKIKPPPFADITMMEGGKHVLQLWSAIAGQFQPVRFDKGQAKPIDAEVDFWRSVEVEKEQLRFTTKGLLEKYAWLMALMMIIITFGITTYMVYDGIQQVAATNAGVSAQNVEVLKHLDSILEGGSATEVAPTTTPVNEPPLPPF